MGNRQASADPVHDPSRNTAPPDLGRTVSPSHKPSFFSKDFLEFTPNNNNEPVELIITNRKENKIKFKFEPSPSPSVSIIASPSSGSIAPGKEKKIKLRAEIKEKENQKFKLTVILGNESHFINVSVRMATGVFGVDPTSLEQVQDGEFRIPEVLYILKKNLIEAGGLKSEGVFRLASEVADINATKNALNNNSFTTSNNINTIANLIKIWYRELPLPIFNALPTETIFYSSNQQSCVDAYKTLTDPNKTLLDWLLDLLADTQVYKEINKMNCQNLAIVVAPNLYDSSSTDAMESLVLSQKCVEFMRNILQWKIDQKYPSSSQQPSSPQTKSRKFSKSGQRARVQSHRVKNSSGRSSPSIKRSTYRPSLMNGEKNEFENETDNNNNNNINSPKSNDSNETTTITDNSNSNNNNNDNETDININNNNNNNNNNLIENEGKKEVIENSEISSNVN